MVRNLKFFGNHNMRVAIISDIHGNKEALYTVLKDIDQQRVSRILCLGDIVGYGPYPRWCLREVCNRCGEDIVCGNHEDYVRDQTDLEDKMNDYAHDGILYTIRRMSRWDVDRIKLLPLTKVIPDLNVTICHSSYTSPRMWDYVDNPDSAMSELKVTPTQICFIGHTHIPFVFGNKQKLIDEVPDDFVIEKDEKYLINVGSVGQPRDGDCRSSYGVLNYRNDGLITYNIRRVFYNISRTEGVMKQANLPSWLYLRLYRGE